MKEKPKIDECFYLVNGQLGRYNKKTRTFEGIPSKDPSDYISAYLRDEFTEKIFEAGSSVTLEPLTKEEKMMLELEINKAWMYSDEELLDLVREQTYRGN